MHNLLSNMDLQTRPLKSRSHFLAMTSSQAHAVGATMETRKTHTVKFSRVGQLFPESASCFQCQPAVSRVGQLFPELFPESGPVFQAGM